MEKILLVNRIKTPDGTIIQSKHRHDYVTYIDKMVWNIWLMEVGII